MISKSFAQEQLTRLVGLSFFPADKAAQTELLLAMRSAEKEATAMAVVTDWLAEQTEAPKPAHLRQLIYSKQAASQEANKKKCPDCLGGGFVTVWQLVTYKGNSFVVAACRTLEFIENQEQAYEYERKLIAEGNEQQSVISAARPCRCLPATHHALTGEHA